MDLMKDLNIRATRAGFAAMLGLVLSLCGWMGATAQVESQIGRTETAPAVNFDIIASASEQHGKCRLDMYVQMPHEEIHFAHEGDQYVGRYDVTLTIDTPNGEQVWESSQAVEVRLKDFASTVSDHQFSLKQLSTDIEPGSYEIDLQVHDEDSKLSAKLHRSVLVTNFYQDSLSVSDVMLANRITTNGEQRTIVPNISGNVGEDPGGFFLFCEVYSSVGVDSLRMTEYITDAKKDTLYHRTHTDPATGFRTQEFLKVSNITLPIGSYLVLLDVTGISGRMPPRTLLHATSSRTFYVHWSDIPMTIQDLDKAVDEMRYIAKDSEIEYIRGGTTLAERKRRFLEYWAKRDPDPSTPRNELMEEYYQRVDYANKAFPTFVEGWRTDRGMIYIRFGPPENVERHPFESGTRPYEVWYYYQQGREFIFVDETGFGDYRLRYPTTDLWGRVR